MFQTSLSTAFTDYPGAQGWEKENKLNVVSTETNQDLGKRKHRQVIPNYSAEPKGARGSGSQEQNPMASGEPTGGDSWRTNPMDGDQISPWRLPSNRLPLIANFSRSCKDTLHGILPAQSIQEPEKYKK